MLKISFLKIKKTPWLISSLLIGVILALAMISAVPMYTRGVLSRVLSRDLEEYRLKNDVYPGAYTAEVKLDAIDQRSRKGIVDTTRAFAAKAVKDLGLPVLSSSETLYTEAIKITPAENPESTAENDISIKGIYGFEDHIKIVNGKLFSKSKIENGIYEVMVSEKAMKDLNLTLDKVYDGFSFKRFSSKKFKIKVVGVYTFKDENDSFWYGEPWYNSQSVIMQYDLFAGEFLNKEEVTLDSAKWYSAVDYNSVKLGNVEKVAKILEARQVDATYLKNTSLYFSSYDIINKYFDRAQKLKLTLWVLEFPVILMILFYILMISNLIIQREKNEISVLKSRGSSRLQILSIYLFQSTIIGICGIVAGPPLSFYICKIIGSSNGFLKFVNRTPLPVSLSLEDYIYTLGAAVLFIIAMTIPAIKASRLSIVEHKQRKSRKNSKVFWEKIYLDFILLALSGYGIYSFKTREAIVNITGLSGQNLPIDPMIYFISTFFILSIGLLFLRVYPYIIKFILWVRRGKWSPQAYASLIDVSRSLGNEQFIMLFLVLTLSIGIFNLKSAAVVNSGIEDRIRYVNGADIVAQDVWKGFTADGSEGSANYNKPAIYIEPPLQPYREIKGIEGATRVFRSKDAQLKYGGKETGVIHLDIMGIVPNEFGEVAWYRNDLMPFPSYWHQYLNLMTEEPKAVLLSSSMKEKAIKVGDVIRFKWKDNLFVEGYVYGFFDYWPAFNPRETSNLIIANLTYMQNMMKKEPCEVWLKTSAGASSEEIYRSIEEKGLKHIYLNNVNQAIVKEMNDPILQGTNGALTLCFIATLLITCLGFIIFWVIDIKNKTLEFGILRAMGLSVRKMNYILIYEQGLISGVAIAVGVIIGSLSSSMFLPMLKIAANTSEKIIPDAGVSYLSSYLQLSAAMLSIMAVCLFILIRFMKEIKMDQAIKLGED